MQKIATAVRTATSIKIRDPSTVHIARLEAAVTRASIIQQAFSHPPLAAGFFIVDAAGAAIGGKRGNNLWGHLECGFPFAETTPLNTLCTKAFAARVSMFRFIINNEILYHIDNKSS